MCSVKLRLVFSIVLFCTLQSTNAAFLRCYHGSLDKYMVTALDAPLQIMPCINPSLPTVVYTFGYRGRPTGPATTAVLSAYIAKRKRNVLLLDWEEEAKSGLLGIALGYAFSAVPNAQKVGRQLGDALTLLTSAGVDMSDIQLVGHSLGAHIMGYAGKRIRENGQVIPRITGLDPARALFEGVLAVHSGLDRTCAKFVDIVHSDPGGYGISASIGTVDIWPNFARNGGAQPGCPIGDFDMFTREDLCNHDRAWRYFVEALASPTAFTCAGAETFEEWVTKGGQNTQYIYMGDLTSTRAKGNFYLNTRPASPFGLGADGMIPNENQFRQRTYPALTKSLRYFRSVGV